MIWKKIYLRLSSAGADSEQKDKGIAKYFLPAFVNRCKLMLAV
jgi:hypothetical protein